MNDKQPDKQKKRSSDPKLSLIKNFVINISRPLTLNENLELIENVLKDLKQFKLDENDYGYLWKGLFYSIWYAEMGKGCEVIVDKLYELAKPKLIINIFDQMNREWFSIDYIRIDKYMFLTRRLTHKLIQIQFKRFIKSSKVLLSNNSESIGKIKCPNLVKMVLDKMEGVGLIDHFLDIFYAECFKIISPFIGDSKMKKLIVVFLNIINKALINRLFKSSKDDRILSVAKIELFNLFNHLKRNKFILEQTMINLIDLCNSSSSKELRSIGMALEKKLEDLLVIRNKQPDILPAKIKLTYNRKKALKNKSKRLANKKMKLREEKESKLIEERSKITEISPEDQFKLLVGIE